VVTRIWHGATPASKSDEYLNLMRAVAIPDYPSIGNGSATETDSQRTLQTNARAGKAFAPGG
jgi:hypothetical protein